MIFQFLKSWLKIALYVFIIIIFPKKLYKGKKNMSTRLLLCGCVVASA